MIIKMEYEQGFKFVLQAKKEKDEQIYLDRWILGGYDKEMSLSDFKEKLQPRKIENQIETLNKVKNILSMEVDL